MVNSSRSNGRGSRPPDTRTHDVAPADILCYSAGSLVSGATLEASLELEAFTRHSWKSPSIAQSESASNLTDPSTDRKPIAPMDHSEGKQPPLSTATTTTTHLYPPRGPPPPSL